MSFIWLLISEHYLHLRMAKETYISQRQLIMSPLSSSRVLAENEPLPSIYNKVIAAKEINHKGQGIEPFHGGDCCKRLEMLSP